MQVANCPKLPRITSGMPSLRVFRGKDEIVRVHHRQRAAEAIALDLGDGDAREEAQLLGEPVHRPRLVPIGEPIMAVRAQERQVEARAVATTVAFGDNDLELAIGADELERFEEGLEDLAGQRVLLLRSVEDDARDARIAEPFERTVPANL